MRQIIDKPRWMKEEEFEAKAGALLRRFEQHYGPVTQPPVPVVQIIEKELDLVIDWYSIPESPGEIILARIDPSEGSIQMNETHRGHFDQFLGSELFTYGHEVGHWILHVVESERMQLQLFNVEPSRPYLCRMTDQDRLNGFEWQANRFAAALLMPDKMVRAYADEVDIHHWPALYRMKDVFAVSISALKNRLSVLKLLYVTEDKQLYPNYETASGQTSISL